LISSNFHLKPPVIAANRALLGIVATNVLGQNTAGIQDARFLVVLLPGLGTGQAAQSDFGHGAGFRPEGDNHMTSRGQHHLLVVEV
jgi:hypothetical protein